MVSPYKMHLFSLSAFVLITSHTKNLFAPAFFQHAMRNTLHKAISEGMQVSAFMSARPWVTREEWQNSLKCVAGCLPAA